MKIISKPIKMVAVFQYGNGTPVPYKFKIRTDSEEEITIKIGKIFEHDRKKTVGKESIIYKCQSVINDIEKIYELKYIIYECRWVLYKI